MKARPRIAKAARKKPAAAKTTSSATPQRSRAHTPRRPRAAEVQRIDRLASELDALPIESLLELHDNLDGLLAASTIDIARLNRLLDAVGI
jgi:hypothetical protein